MRLGFVEGLRFILASVSHDPLATFRHELLLAHLFVAGNLVLTRLFDSLILFGKELLLGTVESLTRTLF